jgi:hypothetical protein
MLRRTGRAACAGRAGIVRVGQAFDASTTRCVWDLPKAVVSLRKVLGRAKTNVCRRFAVFRKSTVERTIAVGPTIRLMIEITPLSKTTFLATGPLARIKTRRAEETGERRQGPPGAQVTSGHRAVEVWTRAMTQWRFLFCSPSSVRGAIVCILCTIPVGVGACHTCPGAPARGRAWGAVQRGAQAAAAAWASMALRVAGRSAADTRSAPPAASCAPIPADDPYACLSVNGHGMCGWFMMTWW